MTLLDRLPQTPGPDADPDAVFEAFTEWTSEKGLELYPAQQDALIEIVSGSNVILATPTGSGKSMVAAGAHFYALSRGERSYYTAPIKALVSEKFFSLIETFGAANVGMMTGDAAVNADAPIICCTAEVLANLALRQGAEAPIHQVVMDEFHFYADPDRGWAWQVPLLELPKAQFLLMSATLGDVSRFEQALTKRTGRPSTTVSSEQRPVPLFFSYATTPLHETLTELLDTKQSPIYVVHFTQAAAMERAQALMSVNMATKSEKEKIAEAIGDFRFNAGFGKTLSRLVRHGVGVHHAGMLPRYRRLVEQLTQAGLLKVVCGTDTLGVGINVPIRTVVFTGLSKYDGVRQRHLKVREFMQIAGRAGRAGFDTAGTVIIQAPDHEVENARLLARAGDDEKKKKRIVRKKPPEGSVSWSQSTFERLSTSPPEPLTSSFAVTHSMVLNVLARPADAYAAVQKLLEENDEEGAARQRHLDQAEAIWDALLTSGVVEKLDEPDEFGRTVRLTVDLAPNFALNQPLSPFALAAFEVLDKESETYALDVLSILEATIDDPRQVLSAQQHKARGEAVAEMKAEGLEYEERMELLEEVTWPKPLEELLEGAFEIYRAGHPWVADHELSPKSVARDLFERAMTFGEYINFYQLARSEGTLLRYLSDVFKALRQTVPEAVRTEEITDLTEWLGELVRQTDSSLLDEWESLRNPTEEEAAAGKPATPTGPPPVTANKRAFTVLVRNAMFRRVELFAKRAWTPLGELEAETDGYTADEWQEAIEEYFEEYDSVGTGPDARGPKMLQIKEFSGKWEVRQILDDPAGDRDWAITADVDLAASDEAGTAVLTVADVGPLSD
ncbi:DEAD/DEAH box helicase [Kineosporia babensis]|uniref:DUF3516 domain-containing protein n=1 Tax=Kineosporia babensis TaxID=499548 RepID=A0A9X1N6W0_9ACTN|nr:DEAD/DEAH box helicase [Kineosporia babensis]MCD5309467.1 DUF3516 domain-containing protein [Kineosporia babensis]